MLLKQNVNTYMYILVEKESNSIYFIFEIESKTDFDMAKGPCFRKYMFF